jgi:hypothetical protein
MKGSFKNKKDVDKLKEKGKTNILKIKREKPFIRILGPEFVSEQTHIFQVGPKQYRSSVCLGGIEGGGYAPDDCPVCAEAQIHWEAKKKLKDGKKSTKKDAQAKIEHEYGKDMQARKQTAMIAIQGESVKAKNKKGKTITVPEWSKEPGILPLSEAQDRKLREDIWEDENFDYMENKYDDLFNRTLKFNKVKKKNSDSGEIMIVPAKKPSKAPEVEGDFPDLEKFFSYKTKAEMLKDIKEWKKYKGLIEDDDDDEEVESDDVEESEDDLDAVEESDEELDEDLEDDDF